MPVYHSRFSRPQPRRGYGKTGSTLCARISACAGTTWACVPTNLKHLLKIVPDSEADFMLPFMDEKRVLVAHAVEVLYP